MVIRPADKGGGLVILNKTDYLAELNRLVEDRDTYEKLRGNPTNKYKAKLKKFVKKAQREELINKKEARYLIPDAPRMPVIYQILKIHKCRVKPPGRPIVSGIDSLFSRLGEYLDCFFQSLS